MRRTTLLLILIITAGFSYAQDFGKTLNHVTVVVSDFNASKKFYTELLGLEQIDVPWLPDKQMFLALGEGLELHVGEVEGVEIKPNGFNHFAIAVADFDEFLNYLRSEGVVYTSLGGGEDYFISTRPDNVRQTWVRDPDGYWIEINDID
jgi:catechol 2,3-dioxygenase-like lactoylglutathione lyase family enzyme